MKIFDNPYSFPFPKRIQWPWRGGDPTVNREGITRRLRRLNAKRVRAILRRRREWFRRWRTAHPTKEKLTVFVLGSNRSGTQMVCQAIGNSPHGWDYCESEGNIAFKDYQLRADPIIKWLIRLSPAAVISFGNILDSQDANDLLTRFDNAKTVWVYRRYEDAANSSTRKWGSHFKDDIIRWVARGELERLGARGKNISTDTIKLFNELYHDDISNEDGACLYWYMRNQLFFDLNLHKDPRVMLVQYEDTVLNQEMAFRRIFEFLGFPYDSAIIDHVFASSVSKHPWPGIDPRIQELCDSLTLRLDAIYTETK